MALVPVNKNRQIKQINVDSSIVASPSEAQIDTQIAARFPACCTCHIKRGTAIVLVLQCVWWMAFALVTGELAGAWGLAISLPILVVFVAVLSLAAVGIYTNYPQLMLPYLVVLSVSLVSYATIFVVVILALAGVFGSSTISFIGVLILTWSLAFFFGSAYFLYGSVRCYRHVVNQHNNKR